MHTFDFYCRLENYFDGCMMIVVKVHLDAM